MMKLQIKILILTTFSVFLFVSLSAQSAKNNTVSVSKSTQELSHPTWDAGAKSEASGTIKPNGHPVNPPVRVEAGKDCIVDLTQPYTISGTLSGSLEINYRIIVHGPCGEPPGTYNEEWIAYGTFTGNIKDTLAEGKFTYTAKVRESGNIDGEIVFGQGITGELKVKGNFKDGMLSYKGSIN